MLKALRDKLAGTLRSEGRTPALRNAGHCPACASDVVFTLDGDPNLKVQGEFTWSETAAEGSLTYEGTLAWESSDARAGSCGIELTANYDFNFGTTGTSSASATLSGTVCGVTVNRTFNYEA